MSYASTVMPLRGAVRTSVSLPARMMAGTEIVPVTITNYSATGLAVTTDMTKALVKGDTFAIFACDQSIRLQMMWQRDRSIGLQFLDTQATVDAFLEALGGMVQPARAAKDNETPFPLIVGRSAGMQKVLARALKAASSTAPVFVTGETGTGKDMLASFIHAHSARRGGTFVPINCASLSGQMAESDLFGHRKGAFTGAINDRAGAVARAGNGTLFLDEFVELDAKEQARLLRFTQSGEYMRLGDEVLSHSNARLISATNRSPAQEIKNGRLRSDLFYRVNTIPIHLAPLRERSEDIPALAEHFLQVHRKTVDPTHSNGDIQFDQAAAEWMSAYAWPGNIRQLSSAILQCVALQDDGRVGKSDIEAAASSTAELVETEEGAGSSVAPAVPTRGPAAGPQKSLEAVITETIERAIKEANGSIPKAAQVLQISPSTIYRRYKAVDQATCDVGFEA